MTLRQQQFFTLCSIVVLSIVLSSCGTANPMQGVALAETHQVYGFFNGLWDGLTAVIAFICDLFGGHYSIYEVHNDGGWYNFGFLLGIGAISLGIISISSSRN